MYKIFYMITKFQKSGGTQCNPTYANAKMPNYKIQTELKQKYYGAPWLKQKKEITRRQNVQNFLYDYKISKIRGHPV